MKTLALSLCLVLGALSAHAQTLTKMWSYTGSLCIPDSPSGSCKDYYITTGPLVSDGAGNLFGAVFDYSDSGSYSGMLFEYNIASNSVTSTWSSVPFGNWQWLTSNIVYANGKVWWSDGLNSNSLYSWTPGATTIVAAPDPNNYFMNGAYILPVTAANGHVIIYGTTTSGGTHNAGITLGYDTTTNKWTAYANLPAQPYGPNGFDFSATIGGVTYLYGVDQDNVAYRWVLNGTADSSVTYPLFSAYTNLSLMNVPSLAYSSASSAIILDGNPPCNGACPLNGYVASVGATGTPTNFNKSEGMSAGGSGSGSGVMRGFVMQPNGLAYVAWPKGGTNNTGSIGSFNPATNAYSTVASFPSGSTLTEPFYAPIDVGGVKWGLTSPTTAQGGGFPTSQSFGQPTIYKITGAP